MRLNFRLLPEQREFLQENKEQSMFVAGYGAGKSHVGTLKTIMRKLQYKDKKVAYYLPNYGLVRDIAFDKFPTLLSELGLKYVLNKSDKEIHIENYGSIIFRSMDNPDTIVGYEVAYSLIDEADILPMDKMEKVYQKILGRNRAVENAMVDAVSTPEGFKWLYNESKRGHFKVIRANTASNKFLPAGYIAQLKAQYPPNLLKAYMGGEFVNLTSGSVYSYFDRLKHNTDIEALPHETLHIGQDFNVGGCVSTIHIIRDDIPYRVDEITSQDSFSINSNVRIKYPGNKIVGYPDASGRAGKSNATRSDIRILKDDGWTIIAPKANGRIQDRVNALNALLSHGKYFININNCPKGADALEQQVYVNGAPEKFNGAGTIDDYNDSSGYFIVRKYGLIKSGVSKVDLTFA